MTNNDEYVAWFKGIADALDGPPDEVAWKKITDNFPDGSAPVAKQPAIAAPKRRGRARIHG